MVALTARSFQRIKGPAGATVLAQLAGLSLGGLAQLWLGRLLGPAGYGEFAQAFALLALLGLAGLLGLRTAALKYVSSFRETGDVAQLSGFLTGGSLIVLTCSTALALLALCLGWAAGLLTATLAAACVAIPLHSIATFSAGSARALGHPVRAVLALRPLREGGVLMGGVLIVLTGVARPEIAMAGAAVGLLAGLAVTGPCARPYWRAASLADWDRRWLGASLPMLWVNLGTLLLRRADILIVGLFAGADAAGIYAICVFLTDLTGVPLQTVGLLFAPEVARRKARGDMPGLRCYVRGAARLSGGAALAVALPIGIYAPEVLALVGPEFASGAMALRILLIGQVARALIGNVNLLAMMTGGETRAAKALVGIAGISIVGGCVLVPLYGINGAACVTATALLLHSLLLGRIGWSASGVRPGPV